MDSCPGRRKKRKTPSEVAREWLGREDPPGFIVQNFMGKGRGVVSTVARERGDFLLFYVGDIITNEEGEKREEVEPSGYRFFLKINDDSKCGELASYLQKNCQYWFRIKDHFIDATEETDRLGRLVNHGYKKERNCIMKEIHGHLGLFCLRYINAGEEILYDYGLKEYPWEKQEKRDDTCYTDIQEKNEDQVGASIPSEVTAKTPVITSSKLSSQKMLELKKFVAQYDMEYFSTFSSAVTHVIVRTNPIGSRFCADRTLKFFQGIANSCWVLDYSWVRDCLSSNKLLPEDEYEIIGVRCFGKVHGPKQSRMGKSLLQGWEICIGGYSVDFPNEVMEQLIIACGGKVLSSPLEFLALSNGVLLSNTDVEEEIDVSQQDLFNEIS